MRMKRNERNSRITLAVLDVLADLMREPEALPDLLAEEAVAHQVARVDAELLALVALGVGELRVVVAQREPAERHVAGLVLHHVRVDRAGRADRWRGCGSRRTPRVRGPR